LEPIPPCHIYVKMAYHLCQHAREGLLQIRIPEDFGNRLFEFQVAADKIAAHHVNKREVDAFPLDLVRLIEHRAGYRLVELGRVLMKDLQANSQEREMRFAHDVRKLQCIYPGARKRQPEMWTSWRLPR